MRITREDYNSLPNIKNIGGPLGIFLNKYQEDIEIAFKSPIIKAIEVEITY